MLKFLTTIALSLFGVVIVAQEMSFHVHPAGLKHIRTDTIQGIAMLVLNWDRGEVECRPAMAVKEIFTDPGTLVIDENGKPVDFIQFTRVIRYFIRLKPGEIHIQELKIGTFIRNDVVWQEMYPSQVALFLEKEP